MPQPVLAIAAEEFLSELCAKHPIGYRPSIHWKDYRVCAGMAYYKLRVIGLSKAIMTDEQRLRSTLAHEYAHLMAYVRQGPKGTGHGPAWRLAMRDLGEEPKVRHSYEVVRNSPRQRVTYCCLRCGREIVRARRLPRRRKFVHANCGGDLRLSAVERVTLGGSGS